MIDIDKLTEAQVRYILKGFIDSSDFGVFTYIVYHMEQPDYPQQTNNEGSDND